MQQGPNYSDVWYVGREPAVMSGLITDGRLPISNQSACLDLLRFPLISSELQILSNFHQFTLYKSSAMVIFGHGTLFSVLKSWLGACNQSPGSVRVLFW